MRVGRARVGLGNARLHRSRRSRHGSDRRRGRWDRGNRHVGGRWAGRGGSMRWRRRIQGTRRRGRMRRCRSVMWWGKVRHRRRWRVQRTGRSVGSLRSDRSWQWLSGRCRGRRGRRDRGIAPRGHLGFDGRIDEPRIGVRRTCWWWTRRIGDGRVDRRVGCTSRARRFRGVRLDRCGHWCEGNRCCWRSGIPRGNGLLGIRRRGGGQGIRRGRSRCESSPTGHTELRVLGVLSRTVRAEHGHPSVESRRSPPLTIVKCTSGQVAGMFPARGH